jgi:hypothetical protein
LLELELFLNSFDHVHLMNITDSYYEGIAGVINHAVTALDIE